MNKEYLSASNLLNIYITAGYPELDSLPKILRGLEKAKADIIEIGLPYSDPLSDGPTIQNSSSIAIRNGITPDILFQQILASRCSVPMYIMCYFNSILQYGVEDFCQKCYECNVEGLIVPDLPIEMYIDKYEDIFSKYNLSNVFLITPQTREERIRLIDNHTDSFIYAVSTSSTTGASKNIEDATDYLKRLSKIDLKNPYLVGFNIATREDYQFVCQYSHGAIIGSAFIRAISKSKNIESDTIQFVKKIKE